MEAIEVLRQAKIVGNHLSLTMQLDRTTYIWSLKSTGAAACITTCPLIYPLKHAALI